MSTLTQQLSARDKMVNEIMKHPPGPKRWRAAVTAWLQANRMGENGLTARQEYALVTRDNAEDRQSNLNKFGASNDPNSGMRRSMCFPTGAVAAIELADPMAFKERTNKLKMVKEFPEFCTAEKY